MPDVNEVKHPLGPAYDSIRSCTAREALELEPRDIEVPEGRSLSLGPDEDSPECIVGVTLRDFNDLQLLGFVPRGLSHEAVMRAIDDDNHSALEMAKSSPARHGTDCACQHEALPRRDDLRTRYNQVRKHYHPALAKLLSAQLRTDVAWDSRVASIVTRWTQSIGLTVAIAIVRDIRIERGAVLNLDSKIRGLLAGRILIHRTGQLRHPGGYLKIWASEIAPLNNMTAAAAAQPGLLPWRALS